MAAESYKPHAVCVPFPAQGHINPMLKLSNLLHTRGFFVTFVNTDYNHRRLLKSGGGPAGLPDFRFATIPDGLPPSESEDSTQDIPSLCDSTSKTCLEPFRNLLTELNSSSGEAGVPPVTCIVADGTMSFTLKAAEELGLPAVLFWTMGGCGILASMQYEYLVQKGYIPLKDMNQITDGYLETTLDEIPGMKRIRLKDFPSFIRTTDPQDFMLNFTIQQAHASQRATAIIFNTFDALEQDTLHAISAAYAPLPIYSIGPLINQTTRAAASLWKEDNSCIKWLDAQHPGSVLYVNFGSITVATRQQLEEFAWGPTRAVEGGGAALPPEFMAEVRDRGVVVGWAPQERVLKHPATGGFLTHCGWNSTIESIANGGLPLICWPFFADQQTNCRYSCVEWGIGFEIDTDVKRDDVAAAVREVMDGDKGKKMKERALELKRKAEEATAPGGSSYVNLDKLIKDVLLR
ncbi:hypothetical protein MIMGU_mgv1a006002mg [Erythranthe guttata]|uniref:Glycosyltransferase n=1 Tax=Erythranthe guttata TaxID=4155 RepID=A0A022PW72_ERYGU|nr:hypothetical protein MIMGU_mgv1a006002mg [Erythranthe guttata]